MRSIATELNRIFRRLSRAPLFTAVTLITLAVGIGANAAIFSVINGVLLRPLPFAEPDRLIGVWHSAPGLGFKILNASPSTYFTYVEENRVFDGVGIYNQGSVSVTGLAEPEQVRTLWVTHTVLPLLRVQPALGRAFTPAEDTPDGPETVILTHSYWQSKFAGNPNAIGQRLLIDGKPTEIVGVTSRQFKFLDSDAQIVLPMRLDRAKVFCGNFSHEGVARLKPGVTIAQASADVARMLPMMMQKFPMPPGFSLKMFEEAKLGPNLHPLKEDAVGDVGTVLWVLMGTVGIVLLIACANVANLFLVRAEGRQQELAIRAALGAGWGRLARELLTESLALGVAGGALGLALAEGGIRLLQALEPSSVPRLNEIAIDAPVVAFTIVVSILAGLLFGLIPVFKYAGTQIGLALKSGGRSSSDSRERHRARGALVIVQVALALVLLVSSGLMIRTFTELRKVDPGFVKPREILTLRLSIPEQLVKDDEQAVRTEEAILHRIEQLPGVQSVAMTSSVTMDGWDSNDPAFVEDFPTPDGQLPAIRRYKWLSPGVYKTMGNRLVAGRDFTWQETYKMAPVVMVSENFAREYWKDPQRAVGRRMRERPNGTWREIIGVVGDERDNGVHQKAPAIIYWPMRMVDFWDQKVFTRRDMAYAIRSPRAGTASFGNEVRSAIWSVNSNLPLAQVRTVQRIYDRSMARTSFALVMLAIASAMALLLGVVGIYGVIAYSVSQRTREIGIRMALGAQQEAVRRMFLRHGFLLTALGVVFGIAAAAGLTRLMSSLLFGVEAFDLLTYVSVSVALLAAAMVASYVPARRATNIDPVTALRTE